MGQSVDTKIVELKFNNDNFADKIDSTLTQLEKLQKDIDQVGFSEAFKNLGKSVKEVDVSSITDGVDQATKGFSKMEIFAVTAMANISNSVVNLGKKIVSSLISPIKQGVLAGGLARARNIEQATFQFEGQKISKSAGNESLSYYKEVMDAVLGTSYSYDVAAKAASQLAASNVGVIETERKLADGTTITAKTLDGSMTKALLGIAGVASMTGSDFDSISQIFTRVAGQGRVMANDLNSIASRGLNAAAVLANYLGKTEEEVRDMVSKGKVSFQDFSDAMSAAFGSHAKDSTLMFQGALDDVNAALARIGADFYGPLLNAGRDILNSITPVVDAIHGLLTPALEQVNNKIATTSKTLSQYLDVFAYMLNSIDKSSSAPAWIKDHMSAWTNIADLYKVGDVRAAIDGLKEVSATWDGMNGTGIDGRQMVADYYDLATNAETLAHYLGITKDEASALIKEGGIGVKEINTAIDGMIDDGIIGFNEFYKSFHKLWSESDKLMGIVGVNDLFDSYITQRIEDNYTDFERFEQHIDTFMAIVQGLSSLWNSTKVIMAGVLDIFMTLLQYMAPLGKYFVQIMEVIAQFVVKVADIIATSKTFKTVMESITDLIGRFFNMLQLNKALPAILGGITKAFDFLAHAIENVYAGIGKVITVVNNTIGKVVDKILEIISNTELLSKILDNLKTAGITVALINLVAAITKPAQVLGELSKALKNIGKSTGSLIDSIGNAFKSIAGMVGKIGDAINEVTNCLKRMQELIVATAILEIAFAIAVLAGSLYLLSQVEVSSAADVLAPLVDYGAIIGSLVGVMYTVSKLGKKVKVFKDVATGFLEMSIAVAILAAAIYALSKIDRKSLIQATGAVEVLLVTLAGIAKLLAGKTTKDTGLKALWSGKMTKSGDMTKGLMGLVAMAEAVKILSKALVSVATIEDPDALGNALGVIEILLGTMLIIAKELSADKAQKMTKGITGLLAMAFAIRMLTKPITEIAALAVNPEQLWQAVGVVTALMAIMTGLTKWLTKDGAKGAIKGGIGLVLMAQSIKMVSQAISELAASAAVDSNALWNAFGIMALAVSGLVLALNLMDTNGLLSKSIAFLAVSYSLQVLSDVLLLLGNNSDAAWAGIGAAAVALTLLAGACFLFKAVPIGGMLKLFATLILGAVVVAAFGAAIGVFGIGISLFGAGLTSLASGIAEISKILPQFLIFVTVFTVVITVLTTLGLPAVGVILAISAAFLLLGIGMSKLGDGLESTAAAIKLMAELEGKLSKTATSIRTFVKELTKMKDDATVVEEAATGIAKSLSKIGNAALKANTNTKALVNAGKNLVTNMSKGVAEGAATIEKAVINMSTKAINALKKKRQNWYDIGSYLIKGMVSGISSQQAALEREVQRLEAKAERAVKAKAKIKSPSRVWMQIGSYMGEGLAIGIRNSATKVEGASVGLATTSEDAVTRAISAISSTMDSELNLDPVITPVVDLTNVDRSASMISSAFGSRIGVGANIANSIGANIQNGSKDSAISKLTKTLDSMTESMNSRALNNYITIDGSADPEGFADDLIRSFRLNARTV